MQMNTNIPMSGVQPDFVNVLSNSNDAAQNFNNYRRQNALADYVQQNGAGIMRGDQNALAGYANLDLPGAMGVQQTQQQMQFNQSQENRLSAQEERSIQEHASQLAAGEAAQQAAHIESTVAAGFQVADAAAWDALMSKEAPDLVGQFDNRETIAGHYLSIADALKRADERNATNNPVDRYQAVGGNMWDMGNGTAPPSMLPGQGEAMTVFGPNGEPIMTQGTGGASQRLTESQSKDNYFAAQAQGALRVFEPVANALTNRSDAILGSLPMGIGGGIQNQDFQVAQQAGNAFLAAILRKESGAAITEQEQVLYGRMYLPQPGDQPAVIEAKAGMRERAVAALQSGMNPMQILAAEQASQAGGQPPVMQGSPAPQAAPAGQVGAAPALTMQSVAGMQTADVVGIVDKMTPEQAAALPPEVRAALIARYPEPNP